ncbi:MAG: SusC/RagA family TonB-linked outer membrane protein [Bacteroidales bacterium]
MRRLTFLLFSLFLGVGLMYAQKKISGTVLSSEDGQPIIGAAVMAKGTSVGTVTDYDGNFSIDVPESVKMLTFTYVGMKPVEEAVKPHMVIKMSSLSQDLDEVVITAMGMKRDRKALGYAAQDLKSDQLNTDGTTSLASAIQGKLTGVDIRQSSGMPGASSQIVIRGARSFSGNNQPLYVVDGMPISSSPDFSTGNSVTGANISDRSIDINPEDIESINVLKGQAASALYGIRASNGVIVITTKRGSKNTSKPQITISTNLSAERVSRKFERQTVYAQGNSVASGYNPGSSMSWGPKITDLPNDPKYGGNKETDPQYHGMYYNSKMKDAGLSGWTTPQIYDNVGDFLGTGFTENTNVSVSQTKDKIGYSFGVSNSYQNGIIPSTGMNRWGARGLVDWQLTDEFKTGFSINYSNVNITSAPAANSGIMNVVYSAPSEYNLKGIPYNVPNDPTKQILFRSTSFNNPYWWADNDEYRQQTGRAFGNAYVEYRPKIGWGDNYDLVFREQLGIDFYTSTYNDVAEVGSATNPKGQINNYGTTKNIFNNLFTATWSGKWEDWHVDVLLGNEVNQNNDRVWDYFGSNFNFYGLPVIGNATNFTSVEYLRKDRTVGFFGSVSASYANMLYLTVTGRNDFVSTMPRGSRSFFYPSVSLGWIFTELEGLKENPILSFGKIRTSFAQVGQAGRYYDNYMTVPSYGGGMYSYAPVNYPVNGVSSYTPYGVLYDPNLKPQNTSNVEAGFDLAFFNNRLRFDYTYSYQDVKDQIFTVPIDGSTGYSSLMTNAGQMKTNSHEFSINGAILENKNYSLDLGVNFTKIKNEVVKLAPGVESIMLGGFVEPQVRAQEGATYPNLYGVAFQRDEKTGMLILNDKGLPMGTSSSVNLGNCSPDFVMGFNLGARYKRVSLSTTWNWQHGGKMYHGTNMVMNYFGATKESLPYHEGDIEVTGISQTTGKEVTMKVNGQDYYQAYYDVTESGIYDQSFLKLRDVTLTYQLPKFRGIDISVFGFARNILIWSKMPNFDPESSQGNGNMGGYFERFSLPNTSSYGGGLKLTF